MARYTGSVCRQCRREGLKLYLKGERCYTEKCAVDRRAYAPGQHGQRRRGKVSEYGLQLREKQKARRTYGVLESQFHKYFKEADRRKGITGENLLQILESRLDNVVYRMGFALSRPEARQLVKHGHFTVNGRKVDIPSYQVRPDDVVAVREASRDKGRFKDLAELMRTQGTMEWVNVDRENLAGKVLRLPTREEIDIPIAEHLIVELYSR
ncbi:30S ribosomal protein S4 [Dethiobacter alkaliphilus]|uniref:Small ribosomal subunit protein uS4 n=1 Tax=Dethiobacter alkaliphilus AHT 1 TaxID=555088 RepID=C0GG87_DETAL|nr:30S ribosomal protein S4 [Dethiobacter alkaliphilus]EEG77776.1 ribosomal protein S4 [Dethiobacter alkaliphilus AHT 1]